ncbi:hypothetical protein Cs7R123_15510 [Catellatospora sp. TT07R-123]|uniref:FkbM family methyltransferase n=1 Tax=Catellatospora sp. TT07R-123 TaxID=2733863 RepID=UPI001B011B93|nr:FkbM family methyltransferase [Catellatospora sp. TT07R-123]GHJ44209.1 hypothetical protein Cs7R123_15510 [Catellatospora sp. TT07R-123]
MGLFHRRLPNGLEVAQVDPGEAALLYREIFVEGSYLREGFPTTPLKTIVDVGANIGLASIFFKQHHPDALVVAIEPGPDTFQALQENFTRHVPGGIARNVAASDRNGTARFGYYPKSPAESGFYAEQAEDTELARQLLIQTGLSERDAGRLAESRHAISYLECETVTLSELFRQAGLDRIDLLKIDVEKAEREVLAGIEAADWARIGHVVLEVHDIEGRLEQTLDLLRGHGFTVDVAQEARLADTDMYMIFAARTA